MVRITPADDRVDTPRVRGEVVDADLHHLEAHPGSADHEFMSMKDPSLLTCTWSSTRRRMSLKAKLMSRKRTPKPAVTRPL